MSPGLRSPDRERRSPSLFFARYLLSDPASPPLEWGALAVTGGRIVAVGPAREVIAAHPGAEAIDFGDAVLLPPLVNAHTHLELTHYPRWASEGGEGEAPGDFVDWILQMIRVKRGVPQERFVLSLAEGIERSLAVGTGAVGDILSILSARSAYRGAPLRGRCYLETLGREPEGSRRRLEALEAVCTEGTLGGLQPGIAPHSPYTLDEGHLADAFDLALRRGLGAAIHLAESDAEVALLRDGGGPLAARLFPAAGWEPRARGLSPAALLQACGGLNRDTLLVHGVHVDASDIELIARSGATVVLCPRSNARLGVGVAPVDRYLAAGVPLALGTDSLASCDSLSVWDEIAFAHSWFGGLLAPAELLAMATRQGARALGLGGEMDLLAPGRGGHFQVLRTPGFPSVTELCDYLVAPGRGRDIAAFYLDGREVLHNR